MTTALGAFLVGLEGLILTSQDKIRIASPNVGGIILFSRNFNNREQLSEYIRSIRSSGGKGKPIFVDHEGGRVQRFREGFTSIPAMATLGEAYEAHGADVACSTARSVGYVLAAELLACGLDMSFTPVLDLDWGNSEIIGNRSFSKNESVVGQLAAALMHGLLLAGMQACGKHFPGHGWVKADSHLALPIDERPLSEISQHDMQPYRSLGSLEMAAIMPAHVVYKEVDAKPACFSEFWLKTTLRNELGYDGAIISDDLDMVGAHGEGPIVQRALKTLDAGCDAALICNNLDDIDTLVGAEMPNRIVATQADRTRRLGRLLAQPTAVTNWDELQKLSAYQRAKEALASLS